MADTETEAVEEEGGEPTETGEEAPKGISRRAVLIGSGAGVAAVAGGAAVLSRRFGASDFHAAHIEGALPVDDPDHATWGRARQVSVPLIPQDMVNPHLHEQSIDQIRVRALFNGRDLGLVLEWEDDQIDEQEGIATFRDAVAVMMPALPGGEEPPPVFMGWEGQPVYLCHWKASWQADIDRGFQDVGDKHPGWFNDVHPYHETMRELGLDDERASVYAPGRHVGNPLAERERTSPVEEMRAEGYGSARHFEQQHARGRGVHEDGRWRVAIGVEGGNAPDLSSLASVPLSFAVWQGQHGQRGARKQYADWTQLRLRDE